MKKILIIIIILILGLLAYAYFIEPQTLKVNEYNIESSDLPVSFDGTKLVQFSDLRYKENNSKILNKVIKNINKENADIVVFTGDLLQDKISDTQKEELINKLSSINVKEYKYAILGDKDSDTAKEILTQSGFIILEDSSEYIFKEDTEPILIAGGNITDEILTKDETIECNFKIALIHKPDKYEIIKNKNISLVLAGHSLGGDIILPFWGPIIKRDGAKTYIDENYKNLYISYGIGTSKYNIRLFNKPSINVFRLNVK